MNYELGRLGDKAGDCDCADFGLGGLSIKKGVSYVYNLERFLGSNLGRYRGYLRCAGGR